MSWKVWPAVVKYIALRSRSRPVKSSELERHAWTLCRTKASTLRARVRELCPDKLVSATGEPILSKVTGLPIVANEFLTKIDRHTNDMGYSCNPTQLLHFQRVQDEREASKRGPKARGSVVRDGGGGTPPRPQSRARPGPGQAL